MDSDTKYVIAFAGFIVFMVILGSLALFDYSNKWECEDRFENNCKDYVKCLDDNTYGHTDNTLIKIYRNCETKQELWGAV